VVLTPPVRQRGAMTDDSGHHGEAGKPGEDGGILEGAEHSVVHALADVRSQLCHLERIVGPELHRAEGSLEPAWRRATAGEHRLPVALAAAVAIGLQLALPAHLAINPTWLLPSLEAALLIGLVAANPRRINRTSRAIRAASLTLIAIISIANAWSAGSLVRGLINGTERSNAGSLLARGAAIYLTNVIVFGLWYWDFDRGGPAARAQALRPYADFLFPQMSNPELAPPDWAPNFVDYFYISFTNATAFSPTDVLPMSRWAKTLMLVQSAVSLSTVALVVARAVNILK
jgi:uncharacterized membrane protein